jgi:two-component system, LuxR family, sensor kinase FixL
MKQPEIPANESDRQAALDRYQILDTLPEQVYDDLTKLAADICGTPIALISLIDRDRQWFKSRIGIDATETPRDISFCGHAVFENAILNVPDAIKDPRFADNPFVINDPNVRFYAGFPLITSDQYTLGTLCVIDRQPKDLTPQQISQLESLSRLVVSQLELRRNEQASRLLNSVVESSNDAIITTTLDGIITSWNLAATKLFGYATNEMLGQSVFILIPPDRKPEESRILERIYNQKKVRQFETVRLHKDGSRREVSVTTSPLVGTNDEVVGVSKIVRDITDRKAADIELKKLSLIASQTDNVAIVADLEGRIEWVNESFHRVTGYTLAEVIGQKPGDILQGEKTSPKTVAEIRYALARREPFSGEILNYHKNGTPYWLLLQINPVFDNDGNLQHFIAIESEITTRKQMEHNLRLEVAERRITAQKLRVLTERLEISNRELLDFAYVASHDLQEPLRKIQAFGDRLKSTCNDGLNEKGQDYLERMLNAAGRAQVLINDLLSFSRVTTQAKPFVPVNLAEILHGVLSDLEIRIEQTGAAVEIDQLPIVDADAMQMRQILQNLISNALKFRQEGVVPLVQVRSQIFSQYDQEHCEIRVIDNGIGFEQKYTDRIFQIFQRLHGRGTYEGTGIGLAICRKIAERHSGSLAAESKPNQGATFIFTMPIHQAKGDSQDAY